MWPRALGQSGVEHRLRAPPQSRPQARRRRVVRARRASRRSAALRPIRRRSSRRTAPGGHRRPRDGRSPARTSREHRPVLPARRRSTASWGRIVGARAERPLDRRRGRVRPRLDPPPMLAFIVGVRPHKGVRQPRGRAPRRPRRPPPAADARLDARAPRRTASRDRSRLVAGGRRQPPARRGPGLRLVDDGRDEDRPRRPGADAASRSGFNEAFGLRRRRARRVRHRAARRPFRADDGHLARSARAVRARARDDGAVRPRHGRPRRARAARSGARRALSSRSSRYVRSRRAS